MGNTKFKKAKSRSLGPRNVSVKTNNYTLRNNLITATHKLKTKIYTHTTVKCFMLTIAIKTMVEREAFELGLDGA